MGKGEGKKEGGTERENGEKLGGKTRESEGLRKGE